MKPVSLKLILLASLFILSITLQSSRTYTSTQNSKGCTTKYSIKNRIQFIDICYNQLSTPSSPQFTPLSLLLQKTYLEITKQNQCYRYFDKIPLINSEEPHPSNQEINNLYANGSTFITKIREITASQISSLSPKLEVKALNWLSLEEFDIQICEDADLHEYTLKYISLFDRKVNKDNIAGQINKKLIGKGFHQTALYTLKINNKYDINAEECSVIFSEVLPDSTYIDYDQLYGILGHPPQTVQLISVQTPAYLAKQFQYQLEIPLSQWQQSNILTYTFSQPIHFRYPRPSASEDYELVKFHPFSTINIKCKGHQSLYLISEDYLANKGVAKVPVGNPDQLKIVSSFTLLSEIICAALLLKAIKK